MTFYFSTALIYMTKKCQTEKNINPQVKPLEAKIGPYNTTF